MQVKQTKKDDLNLSVSIEIGKEDYAEVKKKKLNEFRRTADLKGFRKGMAPMSLIEKLHGQTAMADAINQVVSKSLNDFIESKKLNIIGEPLPSEKEDKNDWEKGENFTFSFDLGLAPKVEISLSKEDKVPFYEITVTAKAQKDFKTNLLKQYGTMENSDVATEEDFIVADLHQGEAKVENAYISIKTIEDSEAKAEFVGKKVGDAFDVDVNRTFPNETDRASMLKVKKEELEAMEPVWKIEVKQIKSFVDAKACAETYDKIFGEGVVKNAEEFDSKVKERLSAEYSQESEFRLSVDVRDYLLKKTDIKLPEEFIKRWLYTANDKKYSMEEINKEFEPFIKDFRWQMIRSKVMEDQKLQVKKEDLLKEAKALAGYQFAMYGMNNVPDEQLNKFAQNILSDEQQSRRIYDKVEDDLVVAYVRDAVTLENKKISLEKMRELSNNK